jgi:myosin heavy subunit
VRSSFVDFYNRYRIFSETQLVDRADSMYKQQCEFILASMNFDRGDFQTGVTKVYLKELQLKDLEDRRRDLREKAALKVQKQFRTMRFLARFRDWREKTAELKPFLRGILARSKMKQLSEAKYMADAQEHSNTYNKYVREQLNQAKAQANAMEEADKESKEWNIAWRREMLEHSQERAINVYQKATQSMAEIECLEIAGWRRRDEADDPMIYIPDAEVAERVHDVLREGTEAAIKEHQRQLDEQEDERKARQALLREEQHLRNVSEALVRRVQAHPLEELAWMRAEEQYQFVAEMVNATKMLDYKVHSAESANQDDPNVADEDLGPAVGISNMMSAILDLPSGLLHRENEKVVAGEIPGFDPEPERVQPDDNIELPPDDEEEEEDEELVNETAQEITNVGGTLTAEEAKLDFSGARIAQNNLGAAGPDNGPEVFHLQNVGHSVPYGPLDLVIFQLVATSRKWL